MSGLINGITLNGNEYMLSGSAALSEASENHDIDLAYAYPTYTVNILDNSGNAASGTGKLTEYLPVVGGETLTLSSELTKKVAYYTSNKLFLSIISTISGINDYTVPEGAAYARFQNKYSAGETKPLYVRKKIQPKNKSFFDIVVSPLVCAPSICITGDSNTYGYGLSDTNLAWSNLFLNALSGSKSIAYGTQSKWCESIGASAYDPGYNYMNNSTLTIWSDATLIQLTYDATYSGAWSWYVDDVLVDSASALSITLDGAMHKITVKFTSGQVVNPTFVITKNISFINIASTGTGITNVPIESGHDWMLVMIGTNDRSRGAFASVRNTFCEYAGKGTYIVPFPNHKTDTSYTHSELETYSEIKEAFKNVMFDIVDCSGIAGNLFYDNTLYQNDHIHFNSAGHRRIANVISGAFGFPLYLAAE